MNQVKVKYQALLMLLFYEKLKEELDIVTEFLWIRALIGFDFDFWSERSYTQNNGGNQQDNRTNWNFGGGTNITQDYNGETSHAPYAGQLYGNGIDVKSRNGSTNIEIPDNGNIRFIDQGNIQYGLRAEITHTGSNGEQLITLIGHLDPSNNTTAREVHQGDTLIMGHSGHCIPDNVNGTHGHIEVHEYDNSRGIWRNRDPHEFYNFN